MDLLGKLQELSGEIDKLVIKKNEEWYGLHGFIYGLVKLGYTEEYLLSRAPVEILLISTKVKEIEDAIVEESERRTSTLTGTNSN